MEYFKSSSVLDKDTYKKIIWKSPRQKIVYAIVFFVFLVGGIICVALHYTTASIISFAWAVIIPMVIKLRTYLDIKKYFARWQESTGTSELEIIASFTDEKIKVHNETTGNTVYIDYDVIRRFAETEYAYVLFSKQNQFFLVNKSAFSHEQRIEFMSFIQGKCKNVGWKAQALS